MVFSYSGTDDVSIMINLPLASLIVFSAKSERALPILRPLFALSTAIQ